ncbi:MAG: hypothetical protein HY712_05050 [candidate division NC10 bacterium]|nr:hypothetical protein [candidate division NC10 bacterium]
MIARRAVILGFVLLLSVPGGSLAGQARRMILALGNPGFINAGSLQGSPGAEIVMDAGKAKVKDLSVIVLANIAHGSLPGPVQQALEAYVSEGGSLLLTGGPQAFGSGGYQAVSTVIPFLIRSTADWRATPFKPPLPIQPGHPIMAGVTFIPIGNLNDMNPRPGANEILRAAGGQGSLPYPLIAETSFGAGRVIGVAFDLNELSGMADRDLFVRNTLSYLLAASRH